MHSRLGHRVVCCMAAGGVICSLAVRPVGTSSFSLFAHSYLDDDGVPAVKVNVEVPYTTLIFIKKGGQFESAFDIHVKILDSKGKLVESTVLHGRVVAENYEKTRSRESSSKLARIFQLTTGDYEIECTLFVKDTHLMFQKVAEVSVPEYPTAGVGLSKPRLFAAALDTTRGAEFWKVTYDRGLEEREHTSFAEFDRQPAFQFQVYADKMDADSVACELLYEVIDKEDAQHLYGRRSIKLGKPTEPYAVSFNVDDWELGAYTFKVKAVLPNPPREAAEEFRFTIQFNRRMLETRFEETLSTLELIADDEELAPLKQASAKERPRAWKDFWKRRDPTPRTEFNEALEEFLRRIRYVAIHFAGAEPGWRTDRGRVYIQHGEPDEMEDRLDPNAQGQYQIWHYYEKNLRFVFYDRFGLGDYRLISTGGF